MTRIPASASQRSTDRDDFRFERFHSNDRCRMDTKCHPGNQQRRSVRCPPDAGGGASASIPTTKPPGSGSQPIAQDDAERRYCYERAVEHQSQLRSWPSGWRGCARPSPVRRQKWWIWKRRRLPEEFGGEHLAAPAGRDWWPYMRRLRAILLAALLGGLLYLLPRERDGGAPDLYRVRGRADRIRLRVGSPDAARTAGLYRLRQ